MLHRFSGILLFSLLLSTLSLAQAPRLQEITDSLRKVANFPGMSVAIVYKDNKVIIITKTTTQKLEFDEE